jgi:PAS domain S-box-containing protein
MTNAHHLGAAPPAASDALAPWQAVIDAMLHAVWLVEPEGLCVIAANHAAAALMGVRVKELVGQHVLDLAATPEDLCFWGEVAGGLAQSIESETFVCRLGGGTAPVTRRVSRVTTADGASLYVVALHDRSEQLRIERALEASAADLRATLESTDDGILVTDLAGRIRHFNRRFATLWNIPDAMLTRREDDTVLEWMRRSVTEPGAYMRRLASIDDTTMLPASDVLKLRSGTVLERVATPQCTSGRPIGRVFSFRDITEKRRARKRAQRQPQAAPA